MKHYYYNSPRGFSNECSVISVDGNIVREITAFAEFEERYINSSDINWKLYRITYKRAREIIRINKAQRLANLRAGLNLTENPVGATSITTATEFFNL